MSDPVYTKADDVPLALREALYAHEILRTIGVPAADIYVSYERIEEPHADHCRMVDNAGVFAVIVKQGEKVVPLVGLATPMNEDECLKSWNIAIRLWNASCNSKAAGWDIDTALVRSHAVEMIAALEFAGIIYGRD